MAIESSEIGAGLGPAVVQGPAAPASLQPGLRRRGLGLAGPVIGENLLETLLGIVDTALVAHLGASATAGVGSAQQIMWFLLGVLSALSIGSSVLVAQAIGAGDTQRASQLARQSLIWSVLLAFPLAVGGVLLAPMLAGIYSLEPGAAATSVAYLQVTMGTIVVLVALYIGGGVLRGAGDSRTPMLVTAVANLVNVVLAYALIYGHAGLPALGAVGSAWATFLARTLALLMLLAVLWRGRAGVTIRGVDGWRPDPRVIAGVLKIGVPAALEQMLIAAAFVALTVVVARLGTATLAAQQIAIAALSFSFLPGIGFGVAATTLVGQSIGAGRIDEGAGAVRIATRWAIGWMGAIGAVVLAFAEPTMRLFTADTAVIVAGAAGLRVVALAQPCWALLFVLAGALRGAGNTRFPLIANGGTIWLTVGLAWLLAHEGSHVFITGRDAQRLQQTAATIEQEGGLVTAAAFDVTNSDTLQAFIMDTAKASGQLDIMVNAAGIDHPGTIAEGKLADWRDMVDTNVIAVLVGSQAAIRAMRETQSQGHIVTISSYAGRGNGFRVYGATKAAINSICLTLRNELEDEPIRVVNIMPGAVATNFGRHFPPEFVNGLLTSVGLTANFKTGDILPESVIDALNAQASAVFASPDDIARAVLFAVTQPHDINVSEVVVGPRKTFPG